MKMRRKLAKGRKVGIYFKKKFQGPKKFWSLNYLAKILKFLKTLKIPGSKL